MNTRILILLLLVDKILDVAQSIQSEQTDLNYSHKRLTGVDVEVFCKKAEQIQKVSSLVS